jgi:hypothetical protein
MRRQGEGKMVWEWEVVGGIETGGVEAIGTGGTGKVEKIKMSLSMEVLSRF